MDHATGDKPLLVGRGLLLIDEFARATGLDRQTTDALVTERKVEGLCHLDGRVVGMFDDVLPTKEQLRSWGLSVREDYNPETHRSYVGSDDDTDSAVGEDGTGGESPRWSMGWEDAESDGQAGRPPRPCPTCPKPADETRLSKRPHQPRSVRARHQPIVIW